MTKQVAQVFFVSISAIVGLAGCDTTEATGGISDDRTQLTVVQGQPVNLSIRALPNGICQFRSGDVAMTETLLADEDGIVRVSLELRPDGGGTNAEETFVFSCTGEHNEPYSHRIDVRFGASSQPTSSSNVVVIGDLPTVTLPSRLRPALTGDPTLIPQEELVRRGYSPRPDPSSSPAEYADWLAAASIPVQMVSGKTREMPGRFHSPTNSTANNSIWSGFVLTQGGVTYRQISGHWTVPTLSSAGIPCLAGSWNYYSSAWTGLDGWGTNDVVQDGTEQMLNVLRTWTGVCLYITSYYSWIEYFPNAERKVDSMPVGPGDQMSVGTWSGDANGNPTADGAYGWFSITNLTRNVAFMGPIARPSGATFVGSSAEWIMERPTVNGSVGMLANYGSVTMTGQAFINGSGSGHNVSTDPFVQVTMVNGGGASMSVPDQVGGMRMRWFNYH